MQKLQGCRPVVMLHMLRVNMVTVFGQIRIMVLYQLEEVTGKYIMVGTVTIEK